MATSKRSPNHLIPAIDAFYHAFWVLRNEGKVEKPDGIAKVLSAVMDANLVKSIMEDVSRKDSPLQPTSFMLFSKTVLTDNFADTDSGGQELIDQKF